MTLYLIDHQYNKAIGREWDIILPAGFVPLSFGQDNILRDPHNLSVHVEAEDFIVIHRSSIESDFNKLQIINVLTGWMVIVSNFPNQQPLPEIPHSDRIIYYPYSINKRHQGIDIRFKEDIKMLLTDLSEKGAPDWSRVKNRIYPEYLLSAYLIGLAKLNDNSIKDVLTLENWKEATKEYNKHALYPKPKDFVFAFTNVLDYLRDIRSVLADVGKK